MKKGTWEAGLEIMMFHEGDNFVAFCPALNLATQGKTFEEADKAFDELIQIFMEEVIEMGTLDKVLEESGWTKTKQHWTPPTLVNQRTKKIQIPA